MGSISDIFGQVFDTIGQFVDLGVGSASGSLQIVSDSLGGEA
ncbi:hypothetical protein [Dietzia sp.]